MSDLASSIQSALAERFGERIAVDPALDGLDELNRIAMHRVHRRYLAGDVSPDLLRLLCACALSAPAKSDLQQADILILSDPAKRKSRIARSACRIRPHGCATRPSSWSFSPMAGWLSRTVRDAWPSVRQ